MSNAFSLPVAAELATATEQATAADPTSGPQGASLEVPHLKFDPGVAYPPSAISEGFVARVTVSLIVELNPVGGVVTAAVEQPQGHGFDEAARDATLRLQFSPARRNGVGIAAKIRFQYTFVPPAPTIGGHVFDADTRQPIADALITLSYAEGSSLSLAVDAAGAWTSDELPPGHVTVTVRSASYGSQQTVAELSLAKHTDVTFRFRAPADKHATDSGDGATAKSETAIEVTVQGERLAPAVSSFTRQEVRQLPGAFGDPFRAIEAMPGVTPIASGLPFFYVRGAPPGNVGYFLDGVRVPYLYHVGLGPSVVHPGMVDRVDLYPGGYPASFGRYAGGIVSGEATAPRPDLHGEANLRLFDVGALAEAGFDNNRGTILLGGRYSYTAALLPLIAPNTNLAYRDYQARITYDVTPRDRVTAFSFGSYDLLGQTTNGINSTVFGSEFYRLNLRLDHDFGYSTALRTDVTLGYDQTVLAERRNAQDRMISVRTVLHHPLSHNVVLRAGTDVTVDGFTADKAKWADPTDPHTIQFNNLFPPRTDVAVGAWSDVVIEAGPRLEFTPGVRADVYTSGGATVPAIDPRIAAKFKVTDHFRIIHAYGLAHQPPSFVVPVPGLTPGDFKGGLQSTFQTSAGVEVDLPEATTATATVFHNAFYHMTDALGNRSNTTTNVGFGNAISQRANGDSYGFEFFLRRRLNKRLGGFLTYTLSRSTRTLDSSVFPSAFDRTHVFNAALAYDLGRNWRAGTRIVFYTGTPIVNQTQEAIVPNPTLSNARNPPFYRVDVRLEKRWQLSPKAWISFVAEVMNVTLSKETYNSTVVGPITIPSIGAEVGF